MMVDSPLVATAGLAPTETAPTGAQPQYSPEFLKADAQLPQQVTSQVPQTLRYNYWQAINGDKLTGLNPKSALMVYDTALLANPQIAVEMVAQHGNDPAKMYEARNKFVDSMVAKDPAKYGGMAESWKAHNAAIGQTLGIVPAGQAQPNQNDMVSNVMRALRSGESGGRYGITSFAEGKGSTASGGYQFADPTWRDWARRTGGEATKYARAKDAPPEVQDAVARNYVTDILKRNNGNPAAVFKEWYAGPKGYLTPQELQVNRGLTVDQYVARQMGAYNKIAGGQAGPETVASYQPSAGPTGGAPTEQAPPEPTAVEAVGDALQTGMAGAAQGASTQAPAAPPTTKPNIELPAGGIAPNQREMYAKALERISQRAASTPPTQPSKPAEPQAQPAPSKEAETTDDRQA